MTDVVSRRVRSYPASLRAECRRMKESGWTSWAIHKLLVRRMGTDAPSFSTVLYWIDDARYETHKLKARGRSDRTQARIGVYRLRGRSEAYRAELVRRLHGEGMTRNAVIKATRVLLDRPVTLAEVDQALEEAAPA